LKWLKVFRGFVYADTDVAKVEMDVDGAVWTLEH
jgi:hypothetical protein